MNNWVVFLIVNVVLVIVLGILTNLITDWIKSVYNKSVFSSRQQKIESLVDEYRLIRDYQEDKTLLVVASLRQFAYGIIALSISIAGLIVAASGAVGKIDELNIYTIYIYLFLCGILAASLMTYQTIIVPIRNTFKFSIFTIEVNAKIRKLGGTFEGLNELMKESDEKFVEEIMNGLKEEERKAEKTPKKKQHRS